MVDPIPERLHTIDTGAGGWMGTAAPVVSPELRDQYIVRSLMEEAITSSQLEGAVTTRRVARELIRTGRNPRNRSEQMIVNNFETMRRLKELKNEPLSAGLLFEMHRLITQDTLEDASAAGRFRRPDENIVVAEHDGTVYHVPPPAEELPERTQRMCDFANSRPDGAFVHPALRSVILHFWLAYDHPFVDGNGRTARALFYWSMLRHGYWLFEFLSISDVILKARSQYYMAFLHTETDDNDLSYFILYHLDVIRRALDALHQYIDRRTYELHSLEQNLRALRGLNHRQRAIIAHALRHPAYRYSIQGHRISHNIVYQTARQDLLELSDKGLLDAYKVGKTWTFEPVSDLERKLRGKGQRVVGTNIPGGGRRRRGVRKPRR
jgi:Fic family protein